MQVTSLPISAIGIDIILKDAILQLEVYQPKRTVSQKKRQLKADDEKLKSTEV